MTARGEPKYRVKFENGLKFRLGPPVVRGMDKYDAFISMTADLCKTRMEHHDEAHQKGKASLAAQFACKEGPDFTSSGAVFTHVEHEARSIVYRDLARLFSHLVERNIAYDVAVKDLTNAIEAAKERLAYDLTKIHNVLSHNATPVDQIGWIKHRARIDILEEHLKVLVSTPPTSPEA